ncbi:unnamed protein product [Heligmosomoides polygyrus]|uniref:AMP_N domain-containing protein n=1 Tax=Heligmosomoides polygyrus TaxID=6339 RepID=A0A183F8J8_HELPZ|nr:unnamed protein product [Heligmosomoides polygyrus]
MYQSLPSFRHTHQNLTLSVRCQFHNSIFEQSSSTASVAALGRRRQCAASTTHWGKTPSTPPTAAVEDSAVLNAVIDDPEAVIRSLVIPYAMTDIGLCQSLPLRSPHKEFLLEPVAGDVSWVLYDSNRYLAVGPPRKGEAKSNMCLKDVLC